MTDEILKRMESLIDGIETPSNRTEDFLVISYKDAVEGRDLVDVYIDHSDNLETPEEYASFITGYAVGQRRVREFETLCRDAEEQGTMQ